MNLHRRRQTLRTDCKYVLRQQELRCLQVETCQSLMPKIVTDKNTLLLYLSVTTGGVASYSVRVIQPPPYIRCTHMNRCAHR